MATRKLKPIEERDPYSAAVLAAFDSLGSVRGSGIKSNGFHDAGAYAQCGHCGRYSDNPKSLQKDEWPCECGKLHGWSGSFVRPTTESKWSDAVPEVAR